MTTLWIRTFININFPICRDRILLYVPKIHRFFVTAKGTSYTAVIYMSSSSHLPIRLYAYAERKYMGIKIADNLEDVEIAQRYTLDYILIVGNSG